ncbi:hypothetical protein ACCO45_012842 [Purpureocillium lilacinum]|uniref:Uncharacterized protein n=1 Tax=Purpureocillium lilacinum TaxID=33203 RepID=A0ACC4DAP8_PURLI
MSQVQEDMATLIFDIAHECLDSFDRVVAENDEALLTRSFAPVNTGSIPDSRRRSSFDFLGLRNSFLFWADYTGALSLMNSSLDARLSGFTDVSDMVAELLEMILRNLHQVGRKSDDSSILCSGFATPDRKAQQPFASHWENIARAIDTALDRLHYIAVAIRKASAQQLDHTVATLLTDEDIVFRRDIASLIRYRFPAARKGLHQQLGDSIAVRRRLLVQSKRHAARLAVRRLPQNALSTENSTKDQQPVHATRNLVKERIAQRPMELASGITKASRPDPHAPGLRRLHGPKPPALTTVVSTITAVHEDSFKYPPVPSASEGETRVQCPVCFMPLERKELEKKQNEHWKRHIDEHLQPYSCLFPECAESLVFFARRREWKAHMESVHSKEWVRKVHTTVWYCDIDHDVVETFETEVLWRKHMQDLASHPKLVLAAPTQAQLDALSPRKQQIALRDTFVCPLCEQIPNRIRPLLEKGCADPTDMYNFVVDHVANHLKSLALMALPCLQGAAQDNTDIPGESELMMSGSPRRLLNENSVVHLPSGIDLMDDISLPRDGSPSWDRDRHLLSQGQESPLDLDFSDYVRPEKPPEPASQEWMKVWESWKQSYDPVSQHSLEKDPILASFNKAKATGSVHVATENVASDELKVDSIDGAGRTRLSFAAEENDIPTARQLLDLGEDVDLADHDGQTPLLWAAANGQESAVRLLLDYGARIEAADQVFGRTPLSWAASKGHIAVVRLLLKQGADVEAADNSRRTPLSWAASRGHLAVVQLLLDSGANPEKFDPKYGRTPLSWAVVRGHVGVVKLLLAHGVNVGVADLEHGLTPLSWAAEYGYADIVHLLLSSGADIESIDGKTRRTPLSFAAENGREKVAKILLAKGANIGATDTQGWTALTWASEHGHKGIVELLSPDEQTTLS